jgi:two-component system, cell cycle sensor histidine kinase and response regulator CckA
MMAARILIVEDSRTQAEALRLLLEGSGHVVQVAPDGETALELVPGGDFDLVMSDITMPGLSGYEVCRHIKTKLRRRELPVLLLTALSDPMDIVQGLEAGADSYVTKPYEPAQLLTRVDHILKNRALRRSLPARVGVSVTFLGSTFTINSEKEQILDLLISTFEDAVLQNRQLRQREEELQAAKLQLSRYADTLEQRLRSILESVPDVLFSLSADGSRFHYVSPASTQVLGFTPERLAEDSTLWHASVHPDDQARVRSEFRRVAASKRAATYDYRLYHPDGTTRWISATLIPALDQPGEVTRVDGLARDVTRQMEADVAIRQQKEFLSKVIDTSPNLIFVKDWEGRFVLANEAVATLYGTTAADLLGRTEADFNRNEDEVARTLAEEREVMTTLHSKHIAEQRVTPAGGGVRWLQSVKVPITSPDGSTRQLLGVATDVSERKQLEQQVRIAQKLEAVGTLAGGVAHDFNNVLAAIRASVDLALLQLEPTVSARSELQEIGAMVDRGAALTRQLLAFSRRQVLEAQPLELSDLVEGTLRMLERIIGADVRLAMERSSEACTVLADPGQLEQVLMNLCVNARDAMPEGGSLALQTERLVIDQEFCALHSWARPGEFVCLTVADSGVGMSAETQARIFEPFFTTKELGRGTGLGLAVVYGIVKQHGGMINVYSEPQRGTTFRIYLPFLNQAAALRPKEAPRQPVGGTETLLLAEDDRVLRNATAKLLARLGYRIIPVATGREALDTITALGREIDLAILDVVMPEINGRTVFDIARANFPELRFLFTTGYSPASLNLGGLQSLTVEVLHKPYGFTDLAIAVRRAIETGKP